MCKYIKKTHTKTGIGIIEVVIGTAIITLSLVGIVVSFMLHFQAGIENTKKIQAVYLLEEGIEITRFLRDGNWTNNIASLSTGVDYYFDFNGLFFETTTTPQYIDEVFERILTIAEVYRRDSDSDIVPATSTDPKTIDPNIRFITVSVSWLTDIGSTTATTTSFMEAYFANIF